MPKGVYQRRPRAPRPWNLCSEEGCGRRARTRNGSQCEMHYYRLRRAAQPMKPPRGRVLQPHHSSHGYVVCIVPGHPLTVGLKSARAYVHRVAFYDHHGAGPFDCHWCRRQVTWSDLHIDHLNDVRDDNRIENLAATCAPCNQRRGHEKMRATMRAERSAPLTVAGETRTLAQWALERGISTDCIRMRLQAGWSVERAVLEPKQARGPGAQEYASAVAATARRSMTAKRKVDALNAARGLCGYCEGEIIGAFHVDHIIPLAMGGEDAADNLQVLHPSCHRRKTDDDLSNIAKAKRRRRAHLGEKKAGGRKLQGRGFDAGYQPLVTGRKFS